MAILFRDSVKAFAPRSGRVGRSLRRREAALLRELIRADKRSSKPKEKNGGARASRAGGNRTQNCVVKARIARGRGGLRAHLRYIQRPGAGEDGQRPALMGSQPADLVRGMKKGKDTHFRFIVSPELSEGLSFETFVPDLVKRIEDATGHKLTWCAAVHRNTAHPHAHLVVSGIDAATGKSIRFSREMISHGVRGIARELLTDALGYKPPEAESDRAQKQVERYAPAPVDSLIEKKTQSDGVIDLAMLSVQDLLLLRRVRYLMSCGLAARQGTSSKIQLAPDWRNSLDMAQRLSAYLGLREQLAAKGIATEAVHLYDPAKHGKAFAGRILASSDLDEHSDRRAFVAQADSGKLFFLTGSGLDKIRANQTVRIVARTPADGKTRSPSPDIDIYF